ncbi:MAG: hypothetical protein WC878_01655 [Candidatus Paceibacterota bacterium]
MAWVPYPTNPLYNPIISAEKAYFPSVLKMGENDYRMWYQSNSAPSNSTIAYATSSDGLSWTLATNAVQGLIQNNAGHPHVEFAGNKFRIWYWNTVSPYTNNAMHYAESVDGITWTNDAAITGNLITSAGGQWNSGSYGAVDVLVNDTPTNAGTNPFNYRYAMYYDATSGGYEQIALGYSADGIAWTLFGTGPVLPKGSAGSWDSGYATVGTVIKTGTTWEMWYSGGISASNEGMGYATSADGLAWTKSAGNPFMSKNDGVLWRNNRTYTPSVIKDGNNYKMWFTGRDNATGNYAIGYSTQEVSAPDPSSGSSSPGTINVVKVVINDNGGTKKFSDFPLFINGTPIVSGITNNFAAPASAFTITETNDSNYSQIFSGDCDINGQLNLVPGDNRFCIVTNNDIGAPLPVLPIPPLMTLVKTVNPLALPAGPGPVTYTYTLRNIGIVPVTDIIIVGDTCSPIVLVSGDTNGDNKLDVDETWVHRCTTNLTETHTNTATVTGWANGISTVDIASATVVVGKSDAPPLIHITKVPTPFALPAGGGMVTYTNVVTNPGFVPLSNIRLTDDKCGPVNYVSGDTNGDTKLDSTEAWVYTCWSNLSQTTTNTVTASGDENGLTARDIAIVTVVAADIVPGLPDTGSASDFGQQVRTIAVNLGQGGRGNNVSTLQQFLISQNKGPAAKALGDVGATAYFGILTRKALAEFQAKVGISPPLGNFGPITRAYISTH